MDSMAISMAIQSIGGLLIGAIAAVLLHCFILDVWRYAFLPRGPTPIPFIGNALSLPKSNAWLKFDQWAKEYGPIYTIWMGRTPALVVTSPEIAFDLLRHRNFSHRPRSVMLGELYMKMRSIITMPYGVPWINRRKLLHHSLKPASLESYKPRQVAEASLLVHDFLIHGSRDWVKIVDRYTAGVIFTTAYGRRIESMDAKVIKRKLEFIEYAAGLILPGRYLAELFPFLKYLPQYLAPWKKAVMKKGEEDAAFNLSLDNLVRSDIAASEEYGSTKTTPGSFIKYVIDILGLPENEHLAIDNHSISALGGTFFTAGFDTTASTLGSCLLALVQNPDVLKLAQAEIDAVVPIDSSRSPTFEDYMQLPYIVALILETLRWRPAVPFGLPHASAHGNRYKGFRIPPGTPIIASTWSLNNHPEYYPSPEIFNPARFLRTSDRRHNAHLRGLDHRGAFGISTFGWGHRSCPGTGLALNTLFIAIAKLIWAFDMKGVEGETIDDMDYRGTSLVRPPNFGLVLTLRSPAHAEIIKKEAEEATNFMKAFEKID